MSIEIGQYRATKPVSLDDYVTEIGFSTRTINKQISQDSSIVFTDRIWFLDKDTKIQRNKKYYLKAQIYLPNKQEKITVKLKDSENEEKVQYIDLIVLPSVININYEENREQTILIELVFEANDNYDYILFEIKRDVYDFPSKNKLGTRGFVLDFHHDCFFGEILNLLELFDTSALVQMKVRGPQGLLMCINGESIRVNPGNVYEINNGYQVDFLGFIPEEQDFFILDYQYQD